MDTFPNWYKSISNIHLWEAWLLVCLFRKKEQVNCQYAVPFPEILHQWKSPCGMKEWPGQNQMEQPMSLLVLASSQYGAIFFTSTMVSSSVEADQ